MRKRRRKMILLSIVVCLFTVCSAFLLWRFTGSSYHRVFTSRVYASENVDHNELKVATYNLKSLDMGKGLDAFVKDIDGLNLDIIALQEVDKNAIRSGNMDMVKEMAEAAGYPYYYFYQTMWIVDGYYGLGILSKYPITSVSSRQLPNKLIAEPRILAKAELRIGAKKLSIYHTHLSYGNPDIRKRQIQALKKELKGEQDAILMGDFNTFFQNNFTIDGMDSINGEQQFLTFGTLGTPDNIYFSKEFHAKDSQVKPSSFSDHNLLYTTLTWKDAS